MKVKLYLVSALLLLFMQSSGQDCSTLNLTYSVTESRCVSTGSINVQVTGGSGNYNYKAIGPITTPTTSSNIITGLPPGTYSILVKDAITGCTKQVNSIIIPGTYSDPRFQLTKTDATCSGNDGTISLMNQVFGRSPFSYTIISPSPSGIGRTSTSGTFTGLTPGEYSIQLRDSCGGIQVRRITIENYDWWFDKVTVTKFSCDSATVSIRLEDYKGNKNTSGSAFLGFTYGVVRNPGDTIWKTASTFNIFLGTKRFVTIVVKDNCGNIHSTLWTLSSSLKPSLSDVTLSSLTCSTFNASISGQNLTNPLYCLYNSSNVLMGCNPTGIFTGIGYGSYCIIVSDACYDTTITRCFTATRPVPAVDATVAITNMNCNTFTATITGQQNLTSPGFCLLNAIGIQISCNNTGVFTGVPYGSYCIQITDICTRSVLSRCFNVTKPLPVLTGYSLSNSTCSTNTVGVSGNNLDSVLYCLYDNLGNVITCDSSGNFQNISQGQYCIRAIKCGDTSNAICFTTIKPVPSVGGTVITNKTCTTFSVTVSGQTNLTNPQFCLYTSTDSLIACNATGIFDNILYGSYCIKTRNTCYDTLITKCFSVNRDLPAMSGTLQVTNSTCSAVSFTASGNNLTNPSFCLYDEANNLVECNSTGVFNNKPYGKYCVVLRDGCIDTTIKLCQTFKPLRGLNLYTSKSCDIGKTNIDVQFNSTSSPYTIRIYHPNGSSVFETVTSVNPLRIALSSLPAATQYKVVGIDACGNRDSGYITPDANIVTKVVSVRPKCPSAAWLNGAGDVTTTINYNYFSMKPKIIRKNGSSASISYSSSSGSQYSFSDLEPATYVIQYTQSTCNGQLFDTVTVPPYNYPSQGQSAIYQCDNNSFSLGADVAGGVSPYSFQIIGSLPDQPRIASAPQSDAVFNINTGTVYSLVRLRTIDACGNATLSDVSVLPLQNISITASNTCYFQNIMLSVDSVPNAKYTWFRKTSPTDSVMIGGGLNYNLPFFVPAQRGDYVCKMVVNNGCATRLSSFTLDGNCGYILLASSFQLNARKNNAVNQLFWTNPDEANVVRYEIERKQAHETSFRVMGILKGNVNGERLFDDERAGSGENLYRIKVFSNNGYTYTNTVSLAGKEYGIVVYPNPVRNEIHIGFTYPVKTNYKLELLASNGQLVFTNTIKNISSTTVSLQRNQSWQPGIYLIRITDMNTGKTELHKLLFE
ncbi:MAG: T9SS type A sorting domain-containing protein [Flavisolibacter sp.]